VLDIISAFAVKDFPVEIRYIVENALFGKPGFIDLG